MFINLSQHPLTILGVATPTRLFSFNGREYPCLDGDPIVLETLPPWEGELPTVQTIPGETLEVDGITIAFSGGEEVINLPPPKEGVIYISSSRVAKATPRRDVVAPGQLVFVAPHEGRGEIAGCLGLQK